MSASVDVPCRIEPARSGDEAAILALYRAAAGVEGGLARTVEEVTPEYVASFCAAARARGLQLVARDPGDGAIRGEVHALALGPRVFAHVLGELTIAVDPAHHGRGLGAALLRELLRRVQTERPHVDRVELIARESNARAIALYERVGFRREGRLEGRIRSAGGGFEADIPMGWRRPVAVTAARDTGAAGATGATAGGRAGRSETGR
ncbi:MAG: N-acetyltransferase [Steroidobacteraceae bacterium]